MGRKQTPSVAASSAWTDEDGTRQPRGDVHAWQPGTNQTLCGVPLHRAGLDRFQHVLWVDAVWLEETTDQGIALCPRCAAATGRTTHRWRRVNPRP
jgi:hypothetical protein